MKQNTDIYLEKLNRAKTVREKLLQIISILSIIVTIGVFWCFKMTGITLAGDAFCGMEEHVHEETCVLEKPLICTLEEVEGHVHEDLCLGAVLVCGQEGVAEEASADMQMMEEPEAAPLVETVQREEKQLVCTLAETEGHAHGDTCYETIVIFEEVVVEQEVPIPTIEPSGKLEELHVHTAECYEQQYICGLEETEGHMHEDACYEEADVCELEEHVHIESCYSDIEADLETSEIWEQTMEGVILGENLEENLVAIARTQIGYQESELNFYVDEEGVRHGYTRYGEWYGNPYGEWATMFTAFCIHYAGAENVPINAGAEAMLYELEEMGMFKPVDEYVPAVGNILFMDKNENDAAETTAIITAIENGQIFAIEGDVEGVVAETTYAVDDYHILGYGRISEEEEFTLDEGARMIARTEEFAQSLFYEGNCLAVYREVEGRYFALDGNGEYVEVAIDEEGKMYTDISNPEMLLWNVTATNEEGGYVLGNMVTQMQLPEDPMPIATYDLRQTGEQRAAGSDQQYARAVNYTVWLDGTNGGLMSYGDAKNQSHTVTGGSTFTLPETWQTSSEYNYKLCGWYDVVNDVYYQPGTKITVDSNMVFYADWEAASYDIGVFNSQVADTISTNEFITVRMFDYNVLFNVLSSTADVTFSNTGHTETWKLLTSGNSPYSGQQTLNYIFRDWDQGSQDITYPSGVGSSSPHYPTDSGKVYSGLYNDRIGSLLFDPSVDVIGKKYLGTADHLFQLCTDPQNDYYGYYYYDSEHNAASYNQSDSRFYVYEYLEQTTVSSTTSGTGKYSDFLPLNSPYQNNNGRSPETYYYDGKYGEYVGVPHYMFDGTNSSDSDVATNFFFGMSVDIAFYLPNAPGSGGNQDVYGKDMHFKFSGDDDVWVFVDGKLVLDLGGIHGMESGDINFSTGEVSINGTKNNSLSNTLQTIGAGEHVLTLYYLERGSSMSNCALYFNLAPRFSFSIQKEDVLTREVLNGAQFSVYTDKACTVPAELWRTKESHDNGDPSTNVFTVIDGIAEMWGMGAGNTYYIKETKPPDAEDYTYARGIISVTLDKQGAASYNVELLEEGEAGVSGGFTVHGFRIDEETQQAYIVATNAPKWVTETTGLWVYKKWADEKDHSGDTVTVYLTATGADGITRRLQEAQLSSANNWRHRWENLPKYDKDGTTEIKYSVEEAYVAGYFYKVEETETFTVNTTIWSNTSVLANNTTYLLKTDQGCLSTLNSNSDTGFQWVSEEVAKSSPLALWTAKMSGNKVMLTNGANQTLTFYYGNGRPTDFYASTETGESNNVKRYFNYSVSGGKIRLYYDTSRTDYYLNGTRNSNQKFEYSTSANSALSITLMTKTVTSVTEKVEGLAYAVTNTPLEEETSLTVTKAWDYGYAQPNGSHEKMQVTMELMANGKSTGRTVTLSLKNGWTSTFQGLPYTDENGEVIVYSVQERWVHPDWNTSYGKLETKNGDPPTYHATVINVYRWGHGVLLPSTGTSLRMMYVLCGGSVMLLSLIIGIRTRRKRERRMK